MSKDVKQDPLQSAIEESDEGNDNEELDLQGEHKGTGGRKLIPADYLYSNITFPLTPLPHGSQSGMNINHEPMIETPKTDEGERLSVPKISLTPDDMDTDEIETGSRGGFIHDSIKDSSATTYYEPTGERVSKIQLPEIDSFDDLKTPTRSCSPCCTHGVLTIVLMAAFAFIGSACYSILAPFYPAVARAQGVSESVIGWIFASYPLTGFVFCLIAGVLISKFGSKTLFCLGAFTLALPTVSFGFLHFVHDYGTFVGLSLLFRITSAIGLGFGYTSCSTILTEAFPENIYTVMAVFETATGAGFLAPAIGGGLYKLGGFMLPFFVMGTFTAAVGVIAMIVLPKPVGNGTVTTSPAVYLQLLKHPTNILALMSCVMFAIFASAFEPTLALFLKDKMTPGFTGLMFLIAPLTYTILAPLYGYLSDRFMCGRILMSCGMIIAAIAMSLVGPAPIYFIKAGKYLWLFVVSFVMVGLSAGMVLVPIMPDMLLYSTQYAGMNAGFETAGVISGLFNACESLGSFIGPFLAAYLDEEYGFQWMTFVIGILAFFVGMVMIMVYTFTSSWFIGPSVNHCDDIGDDDVDGKGFTIY